MTCFWVRLTGLALALLVFGSSPVRAQDSQSREGASQQTAELVISPASLPKPMLGERYEQQLRPGGGTPPFHWRVEKGDLPPGITISPEGVLSGTATSAGDYTFTLAVEDSSTLPLRGQRELRLSTRRPLMLAWKVEPHPDSRAIGGSVDVSNESPDVLDLTFVVLAVNEYGKAFALGYQHFELGPEKAQSIEFTSNVPAGSYEVHADAVAEVPERNLIRRAWLETAARLPMSSQP